MEKQTLSDKIVSNMVETKWDNEGNPLKFTNKLSYFETDVKEFIKELKESLDGDDYLVSVISLIDKLAGEKLI